LSGNKKKHINCSLNSIIHFFVILIIVSLVHDFNEFEYFQLEAEEHEEGEDEEEEDKNTAARGIVKIHVPTVRTAVISDFSISETILSSIRRHQDLNPWRDIQSHQHQDSLKLLPGGLTKSEYMVHVQRFFIEHHIAGILNLHIIMYTPYCF
jgi:hypothetical protein